MDDKHRAARASAIMGDDLVVEALSVVKEYHMDTILSAESADEDVLEARRMILALEQVTNHLESVMLDGEINKKDGTVSNTTDLMEIAEGLIQVDEPATETEETLEVEAEEVEEFVEEVEAETDEAEEMELEAEAEGEVDESDDETEEDDGYEELEIDTYTVKVDGVEQQVTLEDLTRSYSGQSYIQKGMEENATARKELENVRQALQAEIQRFTEFAKKAQTQGLKPEPTPPSPDLAETDPIGYTQLDAKYRQEKAEWDSQKAEMDRLRGDQEAQQQQRMQAHLAEQSRRLQERVPEFATEQSANEMKGKLLKVGTEVYGFSKEEMGSIADSRSIEVLVDALKYRELVSGKAKAKKKPPAPRNVKPKAKRIQTKAAERQKLEQRAKKSGKITDFVDLIVAG